MCSDLFDACKTTFHVWDSGALDSFGHVCVLIYALACVRSITHNGIGVARGCGGWVIVTPYILVVMDYADCM